MFFWGGVVCRSEPTTKKYNLAYEVSTFILKVHSELCDDITLSSVKYSTVQYNFV